MHGVWRMDDIFLQIMTQECFLIILQTLHSTLKLGFCTYFRMKLADIPFATRLGHRNNLGSRACFRAKNEGNETALRQANYADDTQNCHWQN